MPAIRVGNGSAWGAPVANGKLNFKWGGPWQNPTAVYAKTGNVGAGNWIDTGYRGYPNPPGAPYVYGWNYSNVQAAWNYPAAGGSPIAYYRVVITDPAGNWLAQENSTDNISPSWAITQDTRYRIYVNSVGVNGLETGYVGPLNVGIGHPSTPNYGYVQRSQAWQSDVIGGAWNADDPAWIGVGGDVLLDGMHWRNMYTPMSGVVARGTNRDVNWVLYGTDYGSIVNNYGTLYSGNGVDHPLNNWGDGSPWGVIARGAGWSTTGNGYLMLWIENLWLTGSYYYNNWEIVSWNPEQGNYYW